MAINRTFAVRACSDQRSDETMAMAILSAPIHGHLRQPAADTIDLPGSAWPFTLLPLPFKKRANFRAELENFFSADMAELESLLGRSLWRDAAPSTPANAVLPVRLPA